VKTPAQLAAEQAAFWNGPGGQGWLAAHDRIERSIAGFSREVMVAAAARPGERVLDIGCGTGGTTVELARLAAPGGSALGVDISQPLIAAARAHLEPRASFEIGDVTSFAFAPDSFDLVFSRFGVMFFADPLAAFTNLRRAIKPTGRLVFICWRLARENPWMAVPIQAATPHLPPTERPGPEEPGQNSFGDRARVERILAGAGFAAPSFRPVDLPIAIGRDVANTIDNLVAFGPLARQFRDATPDQATKAKAAIAEAVTPFAGPNGVSLAGACWLVKAAAR
jgi:SAM-dependent methyltransferase